MVENRQAVALPYDHRDDESRVDPYGRWKKMRDEAPLVHSDQYGGFYVLSRYGDVCDIARRPTEFSSGLERTTIPRRPIPDLPPLNSDPPDHAMYRRILNPYFSPAKVAAYEPWIREITADIMESLLARDEFDLATEFGLALTRTAIIRILGMQDAPEQLNRWADDLVIVGGEAGVHAGKMIFEFVKEEIGRRQLAPGDDLLSTMLKADFEGRSLRIDDEILPATVLLLIAGLETTASAIAGIVLYLLDNPEQRTRLIDEPGIWNLAVDELLRWVTPAPVHSRTVRQDTVVNGCPMNSGDRIMLLFGSGNRDEREFPEPDSVLLDRHPNRHLTFGIGPHRCMGSHLAKLEIRVALEAMLPHLDKLCIADRDKIVWKAAESRGILHLPVVRK